MGGGPLQEGFDRAAVWPLMTLHAIPDADRPETWAALREMEGVLREVRARQAKEAAP